MKTHDATAQGMNHLGVSKEAISHAKDMLQGHYPNHREYKVADALLKLIEAVDETPRSEIAENVPCRLGDAVGFLRRAANHLEHSGAADKLLAEIGVFIMSIHPLECGPLAVCSPRSAIGTNDELEKWKRWAEYACRRFKEETGKDLQAEAK
jgi:hypothetical protein